ncbi:MAG TPA: LLM class flavin-dependent oxidoreductase [Solirubrobacterales bacterium]|jgi:alkanesulfonate monooxygenase SsuD/methylene tetrahydromethanopterin reductase-like flavin-dependent oxidoreductase (luciferase family)
MRIGIGLPNAVAGTTGGQLRDWARESEAAGFSTLGTIDRIVYGNYDPLVALAGAAAVTERIRLASTVALGPVFAPAARIAKQFLSLDALAGGGRAVLGIAPGGRPDDYEVTGMEMSERGRWMDHAVAQIREVWDGTGDGERIGPRPADGAGPTLLVGGWVDAAYRRAAQYGDGWIMGGGSPDQFRQSLEGLLAAWEREGRDGKPQTAALSYFALGPDGERDAQAYLGDYYAFLGEETARAITSGAARDADTVRAYIAAFEEAGCDELIFFPCSNDPEQVGLLAEAVF